MLHFLTIDKKYFSDAVESERIPETAYYRIAIPELFSAPKAIISQSK
jgi:UDP-glucose/galactose:(glucosyl)LPS alpha-1,2-glucosyl/galactosyltransferase